MKTEEKSVNNKKLIPFWVIERALEGDIQAINKILKHYEGYIAKLSVRIKIGVCFYSSNAKSCNCSRGRKELFAGGGNLIACRLQVFTSSSNLLHSSGRLIGLRLQLFEIFFRFDDLPLKSIIFQELFDILKL